MASLCVQVVKLTPDQKAAAKECELALYCGAVPGFEDGQCQELADFFGVTVRKAALSGCTFNRDALFNDESLKKGSTQGDYRRPLRQYVVSSGGHSSCKFFGFVYFTSRRAGVGQQAQRGECSAMALPRVYPSRSRRAVPLREGEGRGGASSPVPRPISTALNPAGPDYASFGRHSWS